MFNVFAMWRALVIRYSPTRVYLAGERGTSGACYPKKPVTMVLGSQEPGTVVLGTQEPVGEKHMGY